MGEGGIVLFVYLVGFVTSSSTTRLYRGRVTRRLTILRDATHETEWGDNEFCLSRSHYTDTDPTSRERAARPQRESNAGPPHQESSALPTELPRPPGKRKADRTRDGKAT